jgi:DNA-binding beta-propeller fold protein YncE
MPGIRSGVRLRSRGAWRRDLRCAGLRTRDVNRRRFLVAALATPAALALDPVRALEASSGGAAVALATADLESHVVAVELATGRVVRRVRTAPFPRSVEASAFGQVLVGHVPTGVVTILEAASLAVRAELRGFREPRYTAMHPGEPLAYVTDSGLEQVVAIDLDRGTVVHRTPVPGPARHVSTNGMALWTALGSAAARIAVLDVSMPRRPRLVRVLDPPFPAHDVVLAPDGGHAWVTSGAQNALAVYRLAGGAPRVLATGAPPQHVAFSDSSAYVACGQDGTVQRRRLDGTPVRAVRVPHGSYNVTFGSSLETFGRPAVVTPSLNEGTIAVLSPAGDVRLVRKVTGSAHDACVAIAG